MLFLSPPAALALPPPPLPLPPSQPSATTASRPPGHRYLRHRYCRQPSAIAIATTTACRDPNRPPPPPSTSTIATAAATTVTSTATVRRRHYPNRQSQPLAATATAATPAAVRRRRYPNRLSQPLASRHRYHRRDRPLPSAAVRSPLRVQGRGVLPPLWTERRTGRRRAADAQTRTPATAARCLVGGDWWARAGREGSEGGGRFEARSGMETHRQGAVRCEGKGGRREVWSQGGCGREWRNSGVKVGDWRGGRVNETCIGQECHGLAFSTNA